MPSDQDDRPLDLSEGSIEYSGPPHDLSPSYADLIVPPPESITTARDGLVRLIERMQALVVGQRALLERLVIALLAGGHVLIEGVPGLAKTRAVRALAQALDPVHA
jgi:hypothetical protein